MKLNKEKLTVIKAAVKRATGSLSEQQDESLTAELTPFCMEMTDEEIQDMAQNVMVTTSVSGMYEVLDGESTKVSRFYFIEGAKFIRDGNK